MHVLFYWVFKGAGSYRVFGDPSYENIFHLLLVLVWIILGTKVRRFTSQEDNLTDMG